MKNIILTGGGTGGHITPNIALIPSLTQCGWNIHYVGSHDGMEKNLIQDIGIPYYAVSTGKLRRYFDLKNFSDIFNILKGIGEAKKILKEIKPQVVFSKGGFVSVPVVYAANKLKIPVIIHESDISIGLANKICIHYSDICCASFDETLNNIPKTKGILTGSPVRQELFNGSKLKGLELCGFNQGKPVLLVFCGSLGSVTINNLIKSILKDLLNHFQVIHVCGKGNFDDDFNNIAGYKQYEYLSDELADIYAMSDLIVGRSGANSIFEFLSLKKPNLLIPLSKKVSRGDQILNAQSFADRMYSKIILEEDLDEKKFIDEIMDLYENRMDYIQEINKCNIANGTKNIVSIINRYL